MNPQVRIREPHRYNQRRSNTILNWMMFYGRKIICLDIFSVLLGNERSCLQGQGRSSRICFRPIRSGKSRHLAIGNPDKARKSGFCSTGRKEHPFSSNDSTVQFFRQFMLHGFEIGTKPKENGGGIYIHLRAPTNYERFALAIDDKGKTTIEKVLSVFFHKKGDSVKRKDYRPKTIYPENGELQMISMHLVYDLGIVLGKMELWLDSNNLLEVNAFNRVDGIEIKEKSESITSVFMYEIKRNALYLFKLSKENIRLPVQWQ